MDSCTSVDKHLACTTDCVPIIAATHEYSAGIMNAELGSGEPDLSRDRAYRYKTWSTTTMTSSTAMKAWHGQRESASEFTQRRAGPGIVDHRVP
jgi:hypothetical protein